MEAIPIPQKDPRDFWDGTYGVTCHCGGSIEWAEAGYVPGSRACRSCLALFQVRGEGDDRQLVPQAVDPERDIIDDAPPDTPDSEVYRVPKDLYPGWYQPVE